MNKARRADRYAARVVPTFPEQWSPEYCIRQAWLAGYAARERDEGTKAAVGLPYTGKPFWFDAGYLDNGHCSFMRARDGASCCGSHGHTGEHHYP